MSIANTNNMGKYNNTTQHVRAVIAIPILQITWITQNVEVYTQRTLDGSPTDTTNSQTD